MFIGDRDNNDVMRDIFIHDARIQDRIITITAEAGEFIDQWDSDVFYKTVSDLREMPKAKVVRFCCLTSHSVTITRTTNQPTKRS